MTICELLQAIATRSREYKQLQDSILFRISLTILFVSCSSNQEMLETEYVEDEKVTHVDK
jgi:hypothetical protein